MRVIFLNILKVNANYVQNLRVATVSVTAVIQLDITAFKPYNDRLGYSVGDGILRVFAERVQKLLNNLNTEQKHTFSAETPIMIKNFL